MVTVGMDNLSGFNASVTVGTTTKPVPQGQTIEFSVTGQTIFRATPETTIDQNVLPKASEAWSYDATSDMIISLLSNGNQLYFAPGRVGTTRRRGTE
jgi:hypothetical protein